jgi:hypothetical protein
MTVDDRSVRTLRSALVTRTIPGDFAAMHSAGERTMATVVHAVAGETSGNRIATVRRCHVTFSGEESTVLQIPSLLGLRKAAHRLAPEVFHQA